MSAGSGKIPAPLRGRRASRTHAARERVADALFERGRRGHGVAERGQAVRFVRARTELAKPGSDVEFGVRRQRTCRSGLRTLLLRCRGLGALCLLALLSRY